MAYDSVVLKAGDRVTKSWNIKDWCNNHEIFVAVEDSLYVEVGDPKVALRFFLRSKDEMVAELQNQRTVRRKWHSLCAEVLTQISENAAIKVTATATGDGKLFSCESGAISLKKSKGKIVEVFDEFIYFERRLMDGFGQFEKENHSYTHGKGYQISHSVNNMIISVDAQMFRLPDSGNNVVSTVVDIETNLLAEAEDSLTTDLKNMFVEHENYADLKLESKDHMTLDAHKFILAARSPYLRKYIDDAMKSENFKGTIEINVNGKPLVAILHWMYTGELHENAGSVMDEIVDCAVLFELTPMMKLLDRKVISICNKENMFRLYQVAQKNGMPNAMDDISAYIRDHL